MFVTRRSDHNPIFVPDRDHYWEAFASFNFCPIRKGRKIYGFYRAMSFPDKLRQPEQLSVIGITESTDGVHFDKRVPFLTPEAEWERYGCEDPRVTFFEGKYYIFYTALSVYPYGPSGIKVAVAVSDDLKKVDERHLVTPFNAKAMTLFPKRVNGKIVVVFSYHTDTPPAKIVFAELDHIEQLWSEDFWRAWEAKQDKRGLEPNRNSTDHVEVGAPPIWTKHGWLFIYSHIHNYFPAPGNPPRIFSIEAMLLDLKDPTKIVGRTKSPVLVPEEQYELYGYVANIVFPSGALLEKDRLMIYYGAADNTTCMAEVSMQDLLGTICESTKQDWHFKRVHGKPVIEPVASHEWEAQATMNPAAVLIDGTTHILYRALSSDNTSSVGYASSKDGLTIDERLPDPIYIPREDFERKKIDGGNSGCEDARIVQIGERLYMTYTAFDGIGPPRVALTSISERDFLARRWKWETPVLISPPGTDDKDACVVPEKIGGKYFVLHRIGTDICGDWVSSLDFNKEQLNKCIRIIGPRVNKWDSEKTGIAAPPIKTKSGWLLLYHAFSKTHHTYRVGALLLDLKDPAIVLSRSTDPIFEPETEWEKKGIVNNVVFPCGLTERKDVLYMYYGGGDHVVGIATMSKKILLGTLERGIPPTLS